MNYCTIKRNRKIGREECPGGNFTKKRVSERMKKAALTGAAALFFTCSCPPESAGPLSETIARAEQASYRSSTDPLEAGEGVASLVRTVDLSGSRQQQVSRLFEAIRVGGSPGLRVRDSGTDVDTRPPATAEETISHGGDCTELAFVAISCLQELGISGGARIVHFRGSPESVTHMVAIANIDGQEMIIDPQADSVGSYALTVDRVIDTISFSEAGGIYHREYGNYLENSGRRSAATGAFERAIAVYPEDAYSHHKLAIIYERTGRRQEAERHHRLALQHDPQNPTYRQNVQGADVTEMLRRGQTAYNDGFDARSAGNRRDADQHFQQCISLFGQVLSSGNTNAEERAFARQHLDECRRLCESCRN